MDSFDDYEYYYEEDGEFEFNPYDSDTYPENNRIIVENEQESTQTYSPPPEVADGDPSIALSFSLNKSREFIHKNLNIPIGKLKSYHPLGLVVLRLEDFSLLRNDQRRLKKIPHLLIVPTEGFNSAHPDFSASIEVLNKN